MSKLNLKPLVGFIFVALIAVILIIFGFVFMKENLTGAVCSFIIAVALLFLLFRLAKQKR